MFGNHTSLTLNGHLIAYFPSLMQAETACSRLRDALKASGLNAKVEYQRDDARVLEHGNLSDTTS